MLKITSIEHLWFQACHPDPPPPHFPEAVQSITPLISVCIMHPQYHPAEYIRASIINQLSNILARPSNSAPSAPCVLRAERKVIL